MTPKTRGQIVGQARRIMAEAVQIIADINYWNDNVRKPGEYAIDPDKDGMLALIITHTDQVVAAEHDDGPIPEMPARLKAILKYGVG